VAWLLVAFEALPLAGLLLKTVTLWTIDGHPPPQGRGPDCNLKVVVLIPTYNEPREVLAPTVAAACDLEPAHDTWVLDDGHRPWVAEMCTAFGARYVRRGSRDDAKAGNINHALALLHEEEQRGVGGADVVAVLDCDHVPLPSFLTATLPWFDDPQVALVQGPQAFYNQGAFDDDGFTGEQGLFFNVLMPARHHSEAGPFWCGSTSLLRVSALRQVGGVATGTITEDLHTTLNLIRAGWRTVYHHQTLAVGLAPETPAQYLVQRRRWGMGAMQILVRERLWAAKKWMSWRNFHEYLMGTLWWLEGIATLIVFAVPAAVLLSGARTSTASPLAFTCAFLAMFSLRLWGAKRLLRKNIRWSTAFALRVMRVPVGLACAWWLVSRKNLDFAVTPKGGADRRARGRAPGIIWVLIAVAYVVVGYAIAGAAKLVPWDTSAPSTAASGLWLALAGFVLLMGVGRIRSRRYATSRRNSPRIPLGAPVVVDGAPAILLDVSVGGAAVRIVGGVETGVPGGVGGDGGLGGIGGDGVPGGVGFGDGVPGGVRIGDGVPGGVGFGDGPAPSSGSVEAGVGEVEVLFPGFGASAVRMQVVSAPSSSDTVFALRVADGDWESLRKLSLWLFHTPPGALAWLPEGVPIVAAVAVADPGGPAKGVPEPDPPEAVVPGDHLQPTLALVGSAQQILGASPSA
jgi:cellulose synthase/poly-beta-1,6-N-acetylglucosamine synthase-like glycosyltransferase